MIIGPKTNDIEYISVNLLKYISLCANVKMETANDKEFNKFKDNIYFKEVVK